MVIHIKTRTLAVRVGVLTHKHLGNDGFGCFFVFFGADTADIVGFVRIGGVGAGAAAKADGILPVGVKKDMKFAPPPDLGQKEPFEIYLHMPSWLMIDLILTQ